MHIPRARRALIVAAALAIPIAVCRPAVAHAGGGQSLLERFQPVTVMDGAEQFAPTSVSSFVADATLETQASAGVWETVDSSPSLGKLPSHPTQACIDQGLSPCYRLNQRDCSPFDGPEGLACYHDAWQMPAPRSVVYGRELVQGRATVLQYWYFSYDDLYSYRYPPDDLFWQAHEGDWEQVTVVVRGDHAVSVGYSQHCAGERRAWGDVERWPGTSHPVVYVANGSHANLFAPGEHPIAEACIPPEAIAVLTGYGLPLPNDHAHPGSTIYGPAGLAGVIPTAIRTVSSSSPSWIRFAGTWGEAQVFHAPAPIGTVVQGDSPVSPPRQGGWQHPLRTLHSWPLAP